MVNIVIRNPFNIFQRPNNVNYDVPDNLFAEQKRNPPPQQYAQQYAQPPQNYQVPQMQREMRPPQTHPISTFFHIFFKVAALFTYLFGIYIFTNSFVIIFVMCILFLSCDFWTVKNVTGRCSEAY